MSIDIHPQQVERTVKAHYDWDTGTTTLYREAKQPDMLLAASASQFAEWLDMIDWYRRCLEDVADRRPVRGLTEAKLGYDTAMAKIKEAAL